jgi:hypothetical protein
VGSHLAVVVLMKTHPLQALEQLDADIVSQSLAAAEATKKHTFNVAH